MAAAATRRKRKARSGLPAYDRLCFTLGGVTTEQEGVLQSAFDRVVRRQAAIGVATCRPPARQNNSMSRACPQPFQRTVVPIIEDFRVEALLPWLLKKSSLSLCTSPVDFIVEVEPIVLDAAAAKANRRLSLPLLPDTVAKRAMAETISLESQ